MTQPCKGRTFLISIKRGHFLLPVDKIWLSIRSFKATVTFVADFSIICLVSETLKDKDTSHPLSWIIFKKPTNRAFVFLFKQVCSTLKSNSICMYTVYFSQKLRIVQENFIDI